MKGRPRTHDRTKIRELSDGNRSSAEIAELTGYTAKFVQQVQLQEDLPRLPAHAAFGHRNPSWKGGWSVDLDGYLLVRWNEHPNARLTGLILAHRIVMEMKIGRLLLLHEVVDHENNLKLDNRPENLRLFDKNGDHLRSTISGNLPNWSADGWDKMNTEHHLRKDLPEVDTYRRDKEEGVVREQQIRLLHERYGISAVDLLRRELHRLQKTRPHPLGPLPSYLVRGDRS